MFFAVGVVLGRIVWCGVMRWQRLHSLEYSTPKRDWGKQWQLTHAEMEGSPFRLLEASCAT